jgi:hypothetical protein
MLHVMHGLGSPVLCPLSVTHFGLCNVDAAATEALAVVAAGLIRKHLEGIRSRPACATDCSAPCSTLGEEHSLAGTLHDPSPPEDAHPDPAGLIAEARS